ncbi:TasA family protein [Sutcliffiella horikoshii]|uniref:TasA family protein n=1 Tax=Sutcliffiella horikoshii TaxID=79883 RepID=UPI001CFE003E|nr:TasA family protein [Sutcliffiella horikoshii]
MDIKKKLLGSAATIALASMATIGGTFAYFSDSVDATSQFTNGTINLQPEKPYLEHFNIKNWKPGDTLVANRGNQEPAMILNNQGTLPMNVFMKVDTSSVKGTHNEIIVQSLMFGDVDLLAAWFTTEQIEAGVTLAELDEVANGDTTLNNNEIKDIGKYIGFLNAPTKNSDGTTNKAGTIKGVKYQLHFKDSGLDQNKLQGDQTSIKFEFTGLQYEGITYDESNLSNHKEGGGGQYSEEDGFDINDRSNEGDKNN